MNYVFKNFLINEINKWKDNQVIDEQSIEKIKNFYNFESLTAPKFSFVLLGYFFFGLALITLIGANWDVIPKLTRLILVVGFMIFVQYCGLIAYKKGKTNKAIGLFFFGNLCFGASIALVSQIYHLGGEVVNLFFWWAFGVFLVAICFCEKYITLQTLILASIYAILAKTDLHEAHFSISYFIVVIFTLLVSIKEKSQFLFILGIVGLYILSFSSFENHKLLFFVIPGLFLFYCSAFKNSNFVFAPKLYEFSISFGVLFLIVLHIKDMESMIFRANFPLLFAFISVIFILPLVFFSIKEKNWLRLLFLAIFTLFIFVRLDNANYETDIILYKVLVSFVSVIFAINLIIKKWIKHGFILLLLSAMIRYFNLAHDYIGTSVLFMLFGLLMIIVSKRLKNEN